MENFTPYSALAGGILIGISASILMYLNGRIAGISGIVGGIFNNPSVTEKLWRIAFVCGLILGAFAYNFFFPIEILENDNINTVTLIFGSVIVGFGTAMGGGCTSGHGVCGVSRFSLRSITATVTFLATAMITVYLVNYAVEASL